VLPEEYRYDDNGVLWTEFPERDLSKDGFECIRSQDIISLLKKYFNVVYQFYGSAFTRRFVDFGFGHNYDLNKAIDKAILDLLLTFDDFMVDRGYLTPEVIFCILSKNK
jgi:hypothetical protein